MQRREFLTGSAIAAALLAGSPVARAMGGQGQGAAASSGGRRQPPASGPILVAVAISMGVTVIDFSGPWEVFQDVMVPERGSDHEDRMPFRLYTVSESKISTSGGLTSGIDLALRVVERYFGRPAAERTAKYMEYQSRGWIA